MANESKMTIGEITSVYEKFKDRPEFKGMDVYQFADKAGEILGTDAFSYGTGMNAAALKARDFLRNNAFTDNVLEPLAASAGGTFGAGIDLLAGNTDREYQNKAYGFGRELGESAPETLGAMGLAMAGLGLALPTGGASLAGLAAGAGLFGAGMGLPFLTTRADTGSALRGSLTAASNLAIPMFGGKLGIGMANKLLGTKVLSGLAGNTAAKFAAGTAGSMIGTQGIGLSFNILDILASDSAESVGADKDLYHERKLSELGTTDFWLREGIGNLVFAPFDVKEGVRFARAESVKADAKSNVDNVQATVKAKELEAQKEAQEALKKAQMKLQQKQKAPKKMQAKPKKATTDAVADVLDIKDDIKPEEAMEIILGEQKGKAAKAQEKSSKDRLDEVLEERAEVVDPNVVDPIVERIIDPSKPVDSPPMMVSEVEAPVAKVEVAGGDPIAQGIIVQNAPVGDVPRPQEATTPLAKAQEKLIEKNDVLKRYRDGVFAAGPEFDPRTASPELLRLVDKRFDPKDIVAYDMVKQAKNDLVAQIELSYGISKKKAEHLAKKYLSRELTGGKPELEPFIAKVHQIAGKMKPEDYARLRGMDEASVAEDRMRREAMMESEVVLGEVVDIEPFSKVPLEEVDVPVVVDRLLRNESEDAIGDVRRVAKYLDTKSQIVFGNKAGFSDADLRRIMAEEIASGLTPAEAHASILRRMQGVDAAIKAELRRRETPPEPMTRTKGITMMPKSLYESVNKIVKELGVQFDLVDGEYKTINLPQLDLRPIGTKGQTALHQAVAIVHKYRNDPESLTYFFHELKTLKERHPMLTYEDIKGISDDVDNKVYNLNRQATRVIDSSRGEKELKSSLRIIKNALDSYEAVTKATRSALKNKDKLTQSEIAELKDFVQIRENTIKNINEALGKYSDISNPGAGLAALARVIKRQGGVIKDPKWVISALYRGMEKGAPKENLHSLRVDGKVVSNKDLFGGKNRQLQRFKTMNEAVEMIFKIQHKTDYENYTWYPKRELVKDKEGNRIGEYYTIGAYPKTQSLSTDASKAMNLEVEPTYLNDATIFPDVEESLSRLSDTSLEDFGPDRLVDFVQRMFGGMQDARGHGFDGGFINPMEAAGYAMLGVDPARAHQSLDSVLEMILAHEGVDAETRASVIRGAAETLSVFEKLGGRTGIAGVFRDRSNRLFHGTRQRWNTWDSNKAGGLIHTVEDRGRAMAYANGSGGQRGLDAASIKHGDIIWSPKDDGSYVNQRGESMTSKEAIEYADRFDDEIESYFPNSRVVEVNPPKNALNLRDADGLKVLTQLTPKSQWASKVINDAKKGYFDWGSTKHEAVTKHWKKELIPQLRQLGYDAITFGDDGHITTALFADTNVFTIGGRQGKVLSEGVTGYALQDGGGRMLTVFGDKARGKIDMQAVVAHEIMGHQLLRLREEGILPSQLTKALDNFESELKQNPEGTLRDLYDGVLPKSLKNKDFLNHIMQNARDPEEAMANALSIVALNGSMGGAKRNFRLLSDATRAVVFKALEWGAHVLKGITGIDLIRNVEHRLFNYREVKGLVAQMEKLYREVKSDPEVFGLKSFADSMERGGSQRLAYDFFNGDLFEGSALGHSFWGKGDKAKERGKSWSNQLLGGLYHVVADNPDKKDLGHSITMESHDVENVARTLHSIGIADDPARYKEGSTFTNKDLETIHSDKKLSDAWSNIYRTLQMERMDIFRLETKKPEVYAKITKGLKPEELEMIKRQSVRFEKQNEYLNNKLNDIDSETVKIKLAGILYRSAGTPISMEAVQKLAKGLYEQVDVKMTPEESMTTLFPQLEALAQQLKSTEDLTGIAKFVVNMKHLQKDIAEYRTMGNSWWITETRYKRYHVAFKEERVPGKKERTGRAGFDTREEAQKYYDSLPEERRIGKGVYDQNSNGGQGRVLDSAVMEAAADQVIEKHRALAEGLGLDGQIKKDVMTLIDEFHTDIVEMEQAKAMTANGGRPRKGKDGKIIHSPTREFKAGREFLNMQEQQYEYARRASVGATRRRTDAMFALFEQQVPVDDARGVQAYEQLKQARDNLRTTDPAIMKKAMRAGSWWVLTTNISSGLIEAGSTPLVMTPLLVEHTGSIRQGGAAMMAGIRAVAEKRGNYFQNKEYQKLIDYAVDGGQSMVQRHEHGWIDVVNERVDFMNMLKGENTKPGGGLKQVLAFTEMFYKSMNKVNAEVSFIAGYEAAKYKNPELKGEALYAEAIRLAHTANGSGGRADRPTSWFKGDGPLGRAAAMTMYQMQSFSKATFLNTFRMLKDSFAHMDPKQRSAARKGLAMTLAWQVPTLGAMGMTGIGGIAAGAFRTFFGVDLEDEIKLAVQEGLDDGMFTDEELRFYSDAFTRGLPYAMDSPIDVSSRLAVGGISGFDDYNGWDLAGFGGPLFSMGKSAVKAITHSVQGDMSQAVKDVMPAGYRRVYDMAAHNGQLTDARGVPIEAQPQGFEVFTTMLGFGATRVTKSYSKNEAERRAVDVTNKETARERDRLAEAYLAGNHQATYKGIQELLKANPTGSWSEEVAAVTERILDRTMGPQRSVTNKRAADRLTEVQKIYGVGKTAQNLNQRTMAEAQVKASLGAPVDPRRLAQSFQKNQMIQQLMVTRGISQAEAEKLLALQTMSLERRRELALRLRGA